MRQGQGFEDRDWNERYQRGGRSFGPDDDEMSQGRRQGQGQGGQGYHGGRGQQMGGWGEDYYGGDSRGQGQSYGQGGQSYGQGQGGQSYGQGQGGQSYGQGQFGQGPRQEYGNSQYGPGQFGGSHYGQMGQGQMGRGQMGQGAMGRDFERDWEDYGRVGGHGQSGRSGWTSRPGYGGGFFEQERGRGMQGQQGRGQSQSQFRGRGPKGYTRSDERIQEEVCELLSEADVDVSEVTVRVNKGEVTLEGTVDSRYAKREIEDIACEARGVKDCQNQLRISSASESDEESAETGRSRGRTNVGSRTGESNRSGSESRSSGNAMS